MTAGPAQPAGYKNAQIMARGVVLGTMITGSPRPGMTTKVAQHNGGIFTRAAIKPGQMVGTNGADPCVGVIVVQRIAGTVSKIFVYHFQGGDKPSATLARDGALAPGAEVTIFGGSNGDPASCGLYKNIIDQIPVDGPVSLKGISRQCGLWVDRDGNLFIHSTEASIPENNP